MAHNDYSKKYSKLGENVCVTSTRIYQEKNKVKKKNKYTKQ